jgi:hypothetical protein
MLRLVTSGEARVILSADASATTPIRGRSDDLARHATGPRCALPRPGRGGLRPARDRRGDHGGGGGPGRGAAGADGGARGAARLCERDVEPIVTARARRGAVPRARGAGTGVRIEPRAPNAAAHRAPPRTAAGVHLAGVSRRTRAEVEAGRGAHAVRRAVAVPQPATRAHGYARRARERARAAPGGAGGRRAILGMPRRTTCG